MASIRIRTALLSVSDKSELLSLAECLKRHDIALLSTGGTHKMLSEAGFDVTEVSDHTGSPEMMDGRVKTLHPKIHGGLLGRRDLDDAVMAERDIAAIDLLVVNLYPFEAAVEQSSEDIQNAIENIDIGGPAMLRSAAKNFDRVSVLVDPTDYGPFIEALDANAGGVAHDFRFALSVKAFERVARYDAAIANYLSGIDVDGHSKSEFSNTLSMQFSKQEEMRYGENPHQSAAFYVEPDAPAHTIAAAKQLQGKAMSYNNVADADAALQCVQAFEEPSCVIVKHANPCGVATALDLETAYDRAFQTDPTSAFGGIIAFNGPLDGALAKKIIDQQFVEVILATDYEQAAIEAIATKKNVRALLVGKKAPTAGAYDYKRVAGGLLVQSEDELIVDQEAMRVVSKRQPTPEEERDLLFAWNVAKFVKSNAIVYAKDLMTVGVGAGQMSRVVSAQIAGIKAEEAGLKVEGSVMASDAFFPFRDGIDAATGVGIRAVIQPGGSIRDEEVIAAADEADMAMIFTGMRHFRH